MKGKITKVVSEKRFFFVDNDYWCHFDRYDEEPRVGDVVTYERKERQDGKKNAWNVSFVERGSAGGTENSQHTNRTSSARQLSGLPKEYIEIIEAGYFGESNCLKDELILEWPQKLSTLFSGNKDQNKSSQVRKYYDYCKQQEGRLLLGTSFMVVRTKLLELIPLTESARTKGHISGEFHDFLTLNLTKAAESQSDFQQGFLPHFQSLIAYTVK